ncbi:hypothetical protein VT98_14302 [Candidatus Electrothrix communis]|uniref:Uncharacterized protein n=1 Tax=Candidatus Electrothrix communis TaxID=1859133 RepID=A0A3S3QC64_9BACT|nr:hypothetical protein VT98_14302 [Candidatus Electrothrix communis]
MKKETPHLQMVDYAPNQLEALLRSIPEKAETILQSIGDFFRLGYTDIQVSQNAVFNTVDPPVNGQFLSRFPGPLNNRCLADVHHLFNNVQFTKTIYFFLFAAQIIKLILVKALNILDVPEPVVNEPCSLSSQAA